MIEEKLLIYLLVFLLLMLCIYCWYKPCSNNNSSSTYISPTNRYSGGYKENEYPRITGGYAATTYDVCKKYFTNIIYDTTAKTVCINQNNACYIAALYNAATIVINDCLVALFGGKNNLTRDKDKGYYIMTTNKLNDKILFIDDKKLNSHDIDKTLNDRFISIIHKPFAGYGVKVAYFHFNDGDNWIAPTLGEILSSEKINEVEIYKYFIISTAVGVVIEAVDSNEPNGSGHYLAVWIFAKQNETPKDWKYVVVNDGKEQITAIGSNEAFDETYDTLDRCGFTNRKVRLIIATDGGNRAMKYTMQDVDDTNNPSKGFGFKLDDNKNGICKFNEVQYDNKFVDGFLKHCVDWCLGHKSISGNDDKTKLKELYENLHHLTIYEGLGQVGIHELLKELKDMGEVSDDGQTPAYINKDDDDTAYYIKNYIPFGLTPEELRWYYEILANLYNIKNNIH